jgi:hypothetical protein
MTKKNSNEYTKKKKNKIPLPIFIMICAVLLFAIYTSISTLILAIWGESILGTVDNYSTRIESTKAEGNRSRTVFKGYWFLVDGKEYRGYVAYASDEAWPNLAEGETRSEYIRYLEIFPYINKPAALSDFKRMGEASILYHIFAPFGFFFLLRLVIRGNRGAKKKQKKATRKTTTAIAPNAPPPIGPGRSEINMFCYNCGNKLPEGALFCANCGTQVGQDQANICGTCGTEIPQDASFCINCGAAVNKGETHSIQTRSKGVQARSDKHPTNLVGFSELYNHPEILEAARSNRKSSILFMWILVIVPLIGFPIAGLLMDDFPFGESLVIGTGIALVMLIINLLALRRSKKPMWEGVVTNKFTKEKYEHKDDSSSTYTEYTVAITTDTGKKKTIVARRNREMYDYLSVGDRVRYHPKFGTYEKYDKSKDHIIYCNVCSMMNQIQNDRCKRCNNLLFK